MFDRTLHHCIECLFKDIITAVNPAVFSSQAFTVNSLKIEQHAVFCEEASLPHKKLQL